jgi:hypothetical protein
MGVVVQARGQAHIVPSPHEDLRLQHHPREMPASVSGLDHLAFRVVAVGRDRDPVPRAQMQVGQLVAG